MVDGEDKENTRAFVGRKRDEGNPNGGCDGFGKAGGVGKQLSGQKRGGSDIEIEKQKSFTGSYFQVGLRIGRGVFTRLLGGLVFPSFSLYEGFLAIVVSTECLRTLAC